MRCNLRLLKKSMRKKLDSPEKKKPEERPSKRGKGYLQKRKRHKMML